MERHTSPEQVKNAMQFVKVLARPELSPSNSAQSHKSDNFTAMVADLKRIAQGIGRANL